jgi:hypothetical protein
MAPILQRVAHAPQSLQPRTLRRSNATFAVRAYIAPSGQTDRHQKRFFMNTVEQAAMNTAAITGDPGNVFMKRDIIPNGSSTQAAWTPAKADSATAASTMNFSFLFLALDLSFSARFPPAARPIRSKDAPSGHTHPQKNLPNTKVSNIITHDKMMPGRMTLSLIDVKNIASGSNLKMTLEDTANNRKNDICEARRSRANFLTFMQCLEPWGKNHGAITLRL